MGGTCSVEIWEDFMTAIDRMLKKLDAYDAGNKTEGRLPCSFTDTLKVLRSILEAGRDDSLEQRVGELEKAMYECDNCGNIQKIGKPTPECKHSFSYAISPNCTLCGKSGNEVLNEARNKPTPEAPSCHHHWVSKSNTAMMCERCGEIMECKPTPEATPTVRNN